MAASGPRRLHEAEREAMAEVVRAVKARAAQRFAKFDEVDLRAWEDQLEILRVVAEAKGPGPGERHLLLDNHPRARRSRPAARLLDADGHAVTLYEDPDWGLLTEVRFAVVRDPTTEPPPGTPANGGDEEE